MDINTSTLHALSMLVRGGRSAVAVLAPDGSLVTNLSSSDLRCAPALPDHSDTKFQIMSSIAGVRIWYRSQASVPQHFSCMLNAGACTRQARRERCRVWCRYLQPNHFGVLALPVGEFLGLLHDAVYVGSCALDGDLRRSTSSGGGPSNGDDGDAGSGRRKPAPTAPSSHQFFAQGKTSTSSVRASAFVRGVRMPSQPGHSMSVVSVHCCLVAIHSAPPTSSCASCGSSVGPRCHHRACAVFLLLSYGILIQDVGTLVSSQCIHLGGGDDVHCRPKAQQSARLYSIVLACFVSYRCAVSVGIWFCCVRIPNGTVALFALPLSCADVMSIALLRLSLQWASYL